MNKRTKFLLGIGVIAALVLGWQIAAFAVHDEVFQLEGDAVDNAANPPDDWENVVDGTQTGTGAGATAFVDELNKNSSIFTGGGSKDQQDIPNWAWKDGAGGLPDKDNLEHSFAASYDTGTKELLYFGADRFDGSGDAAIGFWFFKDEVTLGDIKTGGGTNFNGVHTPGDILVLSDFSNGGTVSTISVYKWNPAVSGNLQLLATSAKADCSTLTATDPDNACAIVNNAQDDDTVPWDFTDKDGNHTYLPGEFFEGGIDLTALGLADQCFSTALAETRSSTSVTATLKDFTLGSFGSCGSEFNTVPVLDDTNKTPITAPVTAGTAVRDSATINVTGTSTWTGNLKFFLCTPTQLDAQGLCSTGGTQVGAAAGITVTQATTQPIYSDAVTPSAGPGKYCFRGVFTSGTNGVPNQTDSDASECFTVKDVSSVTTAQTWRPNDSATVTTQGGTPVAGSVKFELFETADCTGPTVYTETDNAAPFVTTNNTYDVLATKTVSWKATYTPTNTNVDPSSHCEKTVLTITN